MGEQSQLRQGSSLPSQRISLENNPGPTMTYAAELRGQVSSDLVSSSSLVGIRSEILAITLWVGRGVEPEISGS